MKLTEHHGKLAEDEHAMTLHRISVVNNPYRTQTDLFLELLQQFVEDLHFAGRGDEELRRVVVRDAVAEAEAVIAHCTAIRFTDGSKCRVSP